MTIIQIDPLGTTSLLCTTSTLDESIDDSDLRSTTITGLSTTLASSGIHTQHIHINMANRYVESLTDAQLVEMDKRLSAKEDEFLQDVYQQNDIQDQPKVYKKTTV